ELLEKLCSNSILPDELDRYWKTKSRFTEEDSEQLRSHLGKKWTGFSDHLSSLGKYKDQMEEFYKLSLARNTAMVENLEKLLEGENGIVFVTGGFHVPGITELLKVRGISYEVFAPQVTKKLDRKTYDSLLSGQLPAVESSFTETLALSSFMDNERFREWAASRVALELEEKIRDIKTYEERRRYAADFFDGWKENYRKETGKELPVVLKDYGEAEGKLFILEVGGRAFGIKADNGKIKSISRETAAEAVSGKAVLQAEPRFQALLQVPKDYRVKEPAPDDLINSPFSPAAKEKLSVRKDLSVRMQSYRRWNVLLARLIPGSASAKLKDNIRRIKKILANEIVTGTPLYEAASAYLEDLLDGKTDRVDYDTLNKRLQETKIYLPPGERIFYFRVVGNITQFPKDFWKEEINRIGALFYLARITDKPFSMMEKSDFKANGLGYLADNYDAGAMKDLARKYNYEAVVLPPLKSVTSPSGELYDKYEALAAHFFEEGKLKTEWLIDKPSRAQTFQFMADSLRKDLASLAETVMKNGDVMHELLEKNISADIFVDHSLWLLLSLNPGIWDDMLENINFRSALSSVRESNRFYNFFADTLGDVIGNVPLLGYDLLKKLDYSRIYTEPQYRSHVSILGSLFLEHAVSDKTSEGETVFLGSRISKGSRPVFISLGFCDNDGNLDYSAILSGFNQLLLFSSAANIMLNNKRLAEEIHRQGLFRESISDASRVSALYRFSQTLSLLQL
ncbi:MAG TPA: hypothetical protein VJC03_07195, partial [bacterium]|nr:hypothetical protein [bacterium]